PDQLNAGITIGGAFTGKTAPPAGPPSPGAGNTNPLTKRICLGAPPRSSLTTKKKKKPPPKSSNSATYRKKNLPNSLHCIDFTGLFDIASSGLQPLQSPHRKHNASASPPKLRTSAEVRRRPDCEASLARSRGDRSGHRAHLTDHEQQLRHHHHRRRLR